MPSDSPYLRVGDIRTHTLLENILAELEKLVKIQSGEP